MLGWSWPWRGMRHRQLQTLYGEREREFLHYSTISRHLLEASPLALWQATRTTPTADEASLILVPLPRCKVSFFYVFLNLSSPPPPNVHSYITRRFDFTSNPFFDSSYHIRFCLRFPGIAAIWSCGLYVNLYGPLSASSDLECFDYHLHCSSLALCTA